MSFLSSRICLRRTEPMTTGAMISRSLIKVRLWTFRVSRIMIHYLTTGHRRCRISGCRGRVAKRRARGRPAGECARHLMRPAPIQVAAQRVCGLGGRLVEYVFRFRVARGCGFRNNVCSCCFAPAGRGVDTEGVSSAQVLGKHLHIFQVSVVGFEWRHRSETRTYPHFHPG